MKIDCILTKKFKRLKEYKSKNPLSFTYIPVLDTNPVYACQYLTKADLIGSHNLLEEVFKEINSNKTVHNVMVDTILYCEENFLWYSEFYKESAKLLNLDCKIEPDYSKCPSYSRKEHLAHKPEVPYYIKIQQPFSVYYDSKKKNYYAEELKFNREGNDPINNYRIKYIVDQHELSEFMGVSYPSWYSLDDLTIYEKYCTKTNTRIRIDFKDGNLHYFIAGASDNWKEIENVPYNMIHVIFALLFRTMDVNASNEDLDY